jgi:hypothetical protein
VRFRITDRSFGRRTADYNDGDMFETRVGTSNVTQNIFHIPEALEQEFVASGGTSFSPFLCPSPQG